MVCIRRQLQSRGYQEKDIPAVQGKETRNHQEVAANNTQCRGCQTMKDYAVHNTGSFTRGFTVCWEEIITVTTAE